MAPKEAPPKRVILGRARNNVECVVLPYAWGTG